MKTIMIHADEICRRNDGLPEAIGADAAVSA